MVMSMKMTAFWNMVPCSLVDVEQCFRGVYCLYHQGDESLIALMMEAVCTSEMLLYSDTTQCYVPESCHLHMSIRWKS
jgi:hypothetical protein